MTDFCPACGHPVRVVGTEEGTNHFEPIEDPLNAYLDYIEEARHAPPEYGPNGPTEEQIADTRRGEQLREALLSLRRSGDQARFDPSDCWCSDAWFNEASVEQGHLHSDVCRSVADAVRASV